MPTTAVVLKDNVWTAITDGTKDALVQAQGGTVAIADGDSAPTDFGPCVFLNAGQFIQGKSGSKIWGRGVDCKVAVISAP